MEDKNGGINIKIDTNNGTVNTSQGNIISNNNINITNQSSEELINEICKKLIDLLKEEKIDKELKESIIDDIETIQEETNKEEPKVVKIKNAYQNVKEFVVNLPKGLSKLTAITTGFKELIEAIGSLIG